MFEDVKQDLVSLQWQCNTFTGTGVVRLYGGCIFEYSSTRS